MDPRFNSPACRGRIGVFQVIDRHAEVQRFSFAGRELDPLKSAQDFRMPLGSFSRRCDIELSDLSGPHRPVVANRDLGVDTAVQRAVCPEAAIAEAAIAKAMAEG